VVGGPLDLSAHGNAIGSSWPAAARPVFVRGGLPAKEYPWSSLPIIAAALGGTRVAAWVGSMAGLLAVAVGIFALWYADKQVKLGRDQRSHASSLALGQFLLQLDEAFHRHQDAHLYLRPGGQWYETADRPTDDEMPAAEAYMGLFERIKIMIDLNLLSADVVERLYGYRVANIWHNDRIMRKKLVKHCDDWRDFLALVRCMEKVRNEEYIPGRWAEYNELPSRKVNGSIR
jgi:hypothetical protein